jgi:hypothetical protein
MFGTINEATGPLCPPALNSVGVVVPSRLTSTVNVLPFGSVVSRGLKPVPSNIPKAKVLPKLEVPLGALSAGPLNDNKKVTSDPYVNPRKSSLNAVLLSIVSAVGQVCGPLAVRIHAHAPQADADRRRAGEVRDVVRDSTGQA